MKFDIEKAIDGTIAMNNRGARVIYPIFMKESDKEKLGLLFHRYNDAYFCDDSEWFNKAKNDIATLRNKLIKKYKEKL